MTHHPDFDNYEKHLIKEINEGRVDRIAGIALWMKYNNLSKEQARNCIRVTKLTPTTKTLEEQSGRECTCRKVIKHDESCPLYNISQDHINAAIDAVLGEEQ